MKRSSKDFFEDSSVWQQEYQLLRTILNTTGLEEAFKWGKPCYTFQNKNVVLIHGFKDYCTLLFHKGVLLKDASGLLVQQTKNAQAARQLRFKNLQEIRDQEKTIKAYVFEAVELEKAGEEVAMKKTSDYEVPEELEKAFKEDPDLEKAFKALTPGRQRGYLLHFSGAKQSKTRDSRIKKCISKIFEGKGLHDQ